MIGVDLDSATRRQVVRSLGSDGALDVLPGALSDADWETRVTAMLVAARLRATLLRSRVKEVPLPAAHQFGLSDFDVRVLISLRNIATELLDQDGAADRVRAVSERLGIPRRFVDAALSEGGPPRNAVELFIHAFVEPEDLDLPLPELLPPGITRRDERLLLGDVIEVVWIPPTTHLLGGEGEAPVREYIPGNGFFAARRPLEAPALTALGIVAPPVEADSDPALVERLGKMADPPVPVTHPDAIAICEAISHHVGVAAELPAADELECAARGTAGRRYAWGNGIERLTGDERTPHGLERFAVPAPQWTSTRDLEGRALVLGGPTAMRCGVRLPWTKLAVVRPIVR